MCRLRVGQTKQPKGSCSQQAPTRVTAAARTKAPIHGAQRRSGTGNSIVTSAVRANRRGWSAAGAGDERGDDVGGVPVE